MFDLKRRRIVSLEAQALLLDARLLAVRRRVVAQRAATLRCARAGSLSEGGHDRVECMVTRSRGARGVRRRTLECSVWDRGVGEE